MIDQFTGQILAGKYEIESVMRRSDSSSIYRGRNVSMDKPVTVKILSPELAADDNVVRRFSAEARTASQIFHPNILNVTDFGSRANGVVYVVYEGSEGESLNDALSRDGQFSVERAFDIAKQIASALAGARAGRIIHGNLNPDNILLARSGADGETVKVFNFASEERRGNQVSTRNVVYISPEQLSGLRDADKRSDIYSLGVILYEMLAGEVPFSSENLPDYSEEPPPPLSAYRQDLPPEIEPIILKALARNPEMRHQSPEEFAEDIENIGWDSAWQEIIVRPKTGTAPANNLWKTAFIVLAGISILAVALIYATSVKQTNPTTRLQADVNGQPVQPINPATGAQEQSLLSMSEMPAEIIANSNMAIPPGTMPGGDGYNPWASGGVPPVGAPPTYIGPGGQVITIDPNNPSQFMPPDGVILVPVPANTNTEPKPTPKAAPANTGVQPTETKPPTEAKPTPKPDKPATEQPGKPKPSSTAKPNQSGKPRDSD